MGDVVSPVYLKGANDGTLGTRAICLNQDGQDEKDAQDKSKGHNNGKSGGYAALSATSTGEPPVPPYQG